MIININPCSSTDITLANYLAQLLLFDVLFDVLFVLLEVLFDVDVLPVVFVALEAFVALETFAAFFVEFLLVAFDIFELFFAIIILLFIHSY